MTTNVYEVQIRDRNGVLLIYPITATSPANARSIVLDIVDGWSGQPYTIQKVTKMGAKGRGR